VRLTPDRLAEAARGEHRRAMHPAGESPLRLPAVLDVREIAHARVTVLAPTTQSARSNRNGRTSVHVFVSGARSAPDDQMT
jgi:hypothetical protein